MKKRVIFVLVFFLLLVKSYAGDITLAVLNFENNSIFQSSEFDPLSKGLAEIINTTLSNVSGLKLVERRRLSSIFDELKLSQSGMLSNKNTMKVGKLIGAKYLVFGSFIAAPHKKIRIDTRIVNVETGLTVQAAEITGKNSKILYLADKLCKKIIKNISQTVHEIKIENSDNVQDVNLKALLHFSRGVEFQEIGQIEKALDEFKQALKVEPSFKLAKERLGYILKSH